MFQLPPAPRMSGGLLRSIVAATAAEPVRRAIAAVMRKDLGIEAALALPASTRSRMPLSAGVLAGRAPRALDSLELGVPRPPAAIPSVARWHARYAAGEARPVEVVERALAEARRLGAARPTMSCMSVLDDAGALRDAEASAARWAKGAPLGPLDGVVVPVKEEVDLAGLRHRLGTAFIAPSTDAADGTSAARLRAAGAILLGHTLMTEMGMSPLGGNVQRPMPRNAHAIDRLAGGSSTGSAIAVASGLAPVALGSDGGGSIRIPACFNGLFGIKPTFGRISRHGDGFDGTMDHLGPIGASAHDLAVFLEACAGEDPLDELTRGTPPVAPGGLVGAIGRGVRGLRIGVLPRELAAADGAVQEACRAALAALEKEGAILVDVEILLAEHAPGIGYLTIGLETYASLLDARRASFDAMGPDLQLLVRLLSTFGAGDYLDAQALRARLREQAAEVLRDVDVLALPTTASVAPEVTALDLEAGFADTPALGAACRFAFFGNLTGLPCGTAPVGTGEAGLPVGLQIVGDAFDEASVLAVLAALERAEVASVRAPRVPVHPLGD
ncbi:MAG: amidase [Sandaracinaceae bacterium]|nr:amidase [Sandaracinaceae bacterium]